MSFADLVTPPLSQGLKQTALLVHSLNKADRAWLLRQLSPKQQENVLVLLNELEILGIPSDSSLLNGVLSPEDTQSQSVTADIESLNSIDGLKKPVQPESSRLDKTRVDEVVAHLELANAFILAEILRQEPAGLIARILLIKNWPWHDTVLEKLNPNLRNQVKTLLRTPSEATITPFFAKSLLLHFFQRYEKSWNSKPQKEQEATHRVLPTTKKGPLHAWMTRIKGIVK